MARSKPSDGPQSAISAFDKRRDWGKLPTLPRDAMPDSKLIVPQSYAELRRAVQWAMINGQPAVDDITIQDVLVEGVIIEFLSRGMAEK